MLSAEEVEQIREAMGDRNLLLRTPAPQQVAPPPPTSLLPLPSSESKRRRSEGHSGGLPDGYISLYAICKQHGVDMRDAQERIDVGELVITTGEWRVGPNTVKKALSPEQQAAFLEWVQTRR